MKDESNTFSVIYALDFNYVSFLKVSLKSLEYHYKSNKKLKIYIIDLGLFEYHKKEIVNIIQNENIEIHWIIPDIREISRKIPNDKSIYETSVYYWLFLSLYLPEDIDKVIMIDCDTIIKTDISKLGETKLDEFGVCAVVDSLRPRFKDGGVNNYQNLNIDGDTPYFNSGVLLLSMRYWNENDLTEKFSKCINEYKENLLLLPDQYPFNVVLHSKIGKLDPKWNQYAFDDNIGEAFIIHYAGEKSVRYLNQFKNEFRFFEQLSSSDSFIKKAIFWNEGFSEDFPEMLPSFKDDSKKNEYSFIEGKLPDSLYKKIEHKCELFDVTRQEFFLGIYLLSAHQFSVNSNDVVVGKVIKELEIPGSNYTPLWVKMDPFMYGDDLKSFFEQMKYNLLKLHKNWMPYGQITSSFIENSYNKTSGFDFMFLYNLGKYENDKSLSELVTPTDNKYPIKIKTGLIIEDDDSQLNWKVYYKSIGSYSNDMLKLSMIFTTLIKGIVDDDLSDLSLVKNLLLDNSIKLYDNTNQTDKEINFSGLLDSFESFAMKSPEKVAFIQGESKVTYGELKLKSDYLATILQKRNIGQEDVVGLAISRNVNAVIGLLGIIKSGAAFCYLDQALPKDRLDYMISLTNLKMTIIDNDSRIKFESQHIINLSEDLNGVNDVDICDVDLKSDRLSYIIFTSGTTGLPKGVLIENEQVVNLLFSMINKIGIQDKDKFLAVTSFTFDISILEILLPLSVGAQLVLTKEGQSIIPHDMIELLEDESITFIQATPTLLNSLIISGWKGSKYMTVISGGEPLKKDLARNLFDSNKRLINVYGPTETTIWSSMHTVSLLDFSDVYNYISIGQPIFNTKFFVSSSEDLCLPLRREGELLISGKGVGRGYLKSKEQTKSSFVQKSVKGKELYFYKTGDYVVRDDSGGFHFRYRKDDQVKIRGFRIELPEIESVSKSFEGIVDSVCVLDNANNNYPKLILFYISIYSDISNDAIKGYLKTKLPEYMIPSLLYQVKTFPTLVNGKINKKQLISEYKSDEGLTLSKLSTNLEIELFKAWSEVLGVNNFSNTSNFFKLGGDSLMLLQVWLDITKIFQLSIKVSDLISNPTFSQMTIFLENCILNSNKREETNTKINIIKNKNNPVLIILGTRILAENLRESIPSLNILFWDIFSIKDEIINLGRVNHALIVKQYVTKILDVYPPGPCSLMFYCRHAALFQETSSQLEALGYKVENIFLFDGPLIIKNKLSQISFSLMEKVRLNKEVYLAKQQFENLNVKYSNYSQSVIIRNKLSWALYNLGLQNKINKEKVQSKITLMITPEFILKHSYDYLYFATTSEFHVHHFSSGHDLYSDEGVLDEKLYIEIASTINSTLKL